MLDAASRLGTRSVGAMRPAAQQSAWLISGRTGTEGGPTTVRFVAGVRPLPIPFLGPGRRNTGTRLPSGAQAQPDKAAQKRSVTLDAPSARTRGELEEAPSPGRATWL